MKRPCNVVKTRFKQAKTLLRESKQEARALQQAIADAGDELRRCQEKLARSESRLHALAAPLGLAQLSHALHARLFCVLPIVARLATLDAGDGPALPGL